MGRMEALDLRDPSSNGEEEFLPQLARYVAQWFPELGGRAIAVTDTDSITAQNRPTLPVAILALNRSTGAHAYKTSTSPEIADDFLIEMWFEVKKYAKKDGSESPFWQYFPYERIRTRLLKNILDESRRREDWGVQYISMDVATDPQAIILTFRFTRNYMWCEPVTPDDEETPYVLTMSVCDSPSDCKED